MSLPSRNLLTSYSRSSNAFAKGSVSSLTLIASSSSVGSSWQRDDAPSRRDELEPYAYELNQSDTPRTSVGVRARTAHEVRGGACERQYLAGARPRPPGTAAWNPSTRLPTAAYHMTPPLKREVFLQEFA